MQFSFQEVSEWPPLAWIARMTPGEDVVRVFHGSRVEVGGDRFVEAVWAGDFVAGDFDQTDVVFGSGGRVRGGAATFVSSCATVDRLQSFSTTDHTWVSNSLVCLLKHADATVDPIDGRYYDLFGTLCFGLDKYERDLPTSRGPVKLCYFNNLRWDGRELKEIEKPQTTDGFRTFADYRQFLQSGVNRMAANLRDPARRFPYEMLGTLSSGYDSPTVATLAAQAGLKNAISFHHVTNGVTDCGEDVARVLGLNLTLIDRDVWRNDHLPEVPFLASDAKGEDTFFHGAKDHLGGKVLMTGHHGDRMWDKNCATVGPHMVRGGRSGLSCSEHRLWIGYLHVALPFMGARRQEDVNTISNSSEMAPWDVGGVYTRPICRRICEEAGVPRASFGIQKVGSSIMFAKQRNQQSPSAREDYYGWLRAHGRDFLAKGRVPPLLRHHVLAPTRAIARAAWIIERRTRELPRRMSFLNTWSRNLARSGEKDGLFAHMFPWAIDRAQRRYAIPVELPVTPPTPAPTPTKKAA